MQRRTKALIGLAGALAAVLATSTACSSGHSSTSGASASQSDGSHGDSHGSTSTDAGADGEFAQMMIPHHLQAVEMSDLVLATTKDAKVRALAEEIKAAQDPEIAQMRGWLASWGIAEAADGMAHHGMLSEEQMAALGSATGTQRDRLFIEGMIAHHEGAVAMAEDVLPVAKNPEVKALAEAIITAQNAEIEQMKTMLASMP